MITVQHSFKKWSTYFTNVVNYNFHIILCTEFEVCVGYDDMICNFMCTFPCFFQQEVRGGHVLAKDGGGAAILGRDETQNGPAPSHGPTQHAGVAPIGKNTH